MVARDGDEAEAVEESEDAMDRDRVPRRHSGGRVGEFFEWNPFWHHVAQNVVASLVVAFVIACVASTIAIAAKGDGSWEDLVFALFVVVGFILIGVVLASGTYIAYLLLDGPAGHLWSSAGPVKAVVGSWLAALVGSSMVVGPDDAPTWIMVTCLAGFLIIALIACLVLYTAMLALADDESPPMVIRRALFRWKLILSITLVADVFGVFVLGIALGGELAYWSA